MFLIVIFCSNIGVVLLELTDFFILGGRRGGLESKFYFAVMSTYSFTGLKNRHSLSIYDWRSWVLRSVCVETFRKLDLNGVKISPKNRTFPTG